MEIGKGVVIGIKGWFMVVITGWKNEWKNGGEMEEKLFHPRSRTSSHSSLFLPTDLLFLSSISFSPYWGGHLVNSETRRRFLAMTHLTAVATQKTATGSTANPASTCACIQKERKRERNFERDIHAGNKRDEIFLGAES